MARTRAGAALTQAHRQAQLKIRAQALQDLLKLYPTWQLGDVDSYERLVKVVYMLTRDRNQQSAALAMRYYHAFAAIEEIPAEEMTWGLQAAMSEPPSITEIRKAVGASARVGVFRALNLGYTEEAALHTGFVRLSGAVGREVMNGGRNTIMRVIERDPRADGWSRVTSARPCAFCAMLASRGPAYKDSSEASAGFQAHDHCSCHPEPAFPGTEWPAGAKQLRELWDSTTFGYSGKDARNAFRRALGK